MFVRPDWRTVQRPSLRSRPTALAATDSACPHGVLVDENEPIFAVGSVVVQDEAGSRLVDLSGVEWHPQQCLSQQEGRTR
jgi:hypothetical protein